MYEQLIERLHTASNFSKSLTVFLHNSDGNAVADLMDEAADAIAELYSEYKDAFAVVATAWRDNPKNITLSAYMMKQRKRARYKPSPSMLTACCRAYA